MIADFLGAAKPVAIMPSDLDLVPHGAGRGLLITGDSAGTALLAAHALIGALDGRASRKKGQDRVAGARVRTNGSSPPDARSAFRPCLAHVTPAAPELAFQSKSTLEICHGNA